MIYQKKTINNIPTKIPLSNSVPVGNPIGTIISTYKKIQPRNYLYCDGSTFDETLYPALYRYLGTNVLPDYRECAMVGAEQNTTDTIATHDVYTEGQFKDDSFKSHKHTFTGTAGTVSVSGANHRHGIPSTSGSDAGKGVDTPRNGSGSIVEYSAYSGNLSMSGTFTPSGSISNTGGVVTRGKRKAVYYYIKAVDGVDISDEDTFLNTVKDYVATVMANNDILSDEETISLSTSSSSPTVMSYDGFLIVKCESANQNQSATISINGVNSSISKPTSGQNVVMTYPFTKGDSIYIVSQDNMNGAYKVRQYKLRDYSGRQ